MFMHKWKRFEFEFKDYLSSSQKGVVGKISLTLTKHFTHRVYDRCPEWEQPIIRRMLYHCVNKRLCELMFWFYKDTDKKLLLRRKEFCIIVDKGKMEGDMVLRTFYKQERKPNEDKFFVINM